MNGSTIEFETLSTGGIFSLLVFLFLMATVVLSALTYRRDTHANSPQIKRWLWALRGIVWFIVVCLFLEPRIHQEETIDRPSRVIVVIDQSLSMTLPVGDSSASVTTSRWEATRDALTKNDVLQQLSNIHELSLYSVGKEAQSIPSPPPSSSDAWNSWWSTLTATDDETRLGDGLTGIIRENRTSLVSGIILFSDGQSNAGSNIDSAIRAAKLAKIPIQAVGLGTEQSPINLRITDLRIPSKVFKGDELRGRALLHVSGITAPQVPVEILVEPTDKSIPPVTIDSRDVTLSENPSVVPIEFKHLPEVEGSWRLIVRSKPTPNEIRVEDNQAESTFEVIDQKTKILLMAGGPTREFRFLRNLLFRDASMSLSVLLQSAAPSASQEADRLLTSFPKKEELFQYDIVIAMDVDWSAFDRSSQQVLEEWVSKQAGGLIIVAGPVNTPKLARTSPMNEIADLLPVVLKETLQSDIDAGRFAEPWPVAFTRDGELASFLKLDDDADDSRKRWKQFPGMFWCYPRVTLKPAAIALATFNDPRDQSSEGGIPLIVTQFFGAGRVLYLGSGELWRLREFGEELYDRLWVRTIREMSQSRLLRGSNRVLILIEGDRFKLGSDLPVRAQVLGTDFQPASAKTLPLTIQDSSGHASSLELKAAANQPGIFEGMLPLRQAGDYRLQLLAPESSELAERRFTVEIPEREFAEPRMNRELLERMTRETGGSLLRLNQLHQLPTLLPDVSERTIVRGTAHSLWDNGWVLSLFVLILAIEWTLRKRAYLA